MVQVGYFSLLFCAVWLQLQLCTTFNCIYSAFICILPCQLHVFQDVQGDSAEIVSIVYLLSLLHHHPTSEDAILSPAVSSYGHTLNEDSSHRWSLTANVFFPLPTSINILTASGHRIQIMCLGKKLLKGENFQNYIGIQLGKRV